MLFDVSGIVSIFAGRMEKRSVAIFVKNLTSGGAEKQAVLLANTLYEAGLKAHFVVFNAKYVHENMRDLLHPSVSFTAFTGSFRERWRKLKEFLRTQQIGVIFSYLTAANAIAVTAAPKSTKVVTGLRCSKLSPHKHIADAILCRVADATVANSYAGQRHFTSKGFPRKKTRVIHNYIAPIPPYQPHEQGDEVKVVCVGRYVPVKDLSTAIDAFARAVKSGVPMRLTLVGYGPLEQELRARVADLGLDKMVEFVINPPNVADYERSADIFLTTSLSEGLSNATMEAMNADLPIVSTRVGDAEVMVKEGENGFLTDVGDVDAIAKALVTLANDPDLRARMGRRSKEILKQGFDREVFTRRYLDLLNQL